MPTYYLSDTNITAGVLEQLATSAPSSLEEAQGWTVDKKASPNYAVYYPDTTRAYATFNATEPSAFSQYGYRTVGALNGVFANANWVLAFKVKCNAYYAQTGYVKFRLWRSVNADGSGATQITPGWQTSTLISFTAANQYKTGTITWSPGATKTLTDEYLFLEIEWSCSVSGGNNAAAVYWVHNEGVAEKLDTPTFNASYSESVSLGSAAGISDSRTAGMVSSTSLPGAAAISENGAWNGFGAMALAGGATLAPAGGLSFPGEVTLLGTSSIAEAADLAVLRELGLTCQAGIGLGSVLAAAPAVSLGSSAGLSEARITEILGSAGLPGTAATVEQSLLAALNSLGLSVATEVSEATLLETLKAISLSGSGALDILSSLIAQGALVLSGNAGLGADGQTESGAGQYYESLGLPSLTAIVKSALVEMLGSSSLSGAANISIAGLIQAVGSALLSAQGNLDAAAELEMVKTCSLAGIASLEPGRQLNCAGFLALQGMGAFSTFFGPRVKRGYRLELILDELELDLKLK